MNVKYNQDKFIVSNNDNIYGYLNLLDWLGILEKKGTRVFDKTLV